MSEVTCANPVSCSSDVVFTRPDTTGVEQCVKCGGWIIGGQAFFSDGKRYCPSCMFDGSGKFVDSVSYAVRYWGPTADVAREIEASKEADEGESVMHPG